MLTTLKLALILIFFIAHSASAKIKKKEIQGASQGTSIPPLSQSPAKESPPSVSPAPVVSGHSIIEADSGDLDLSLIDENGLEMTSVAVPLDVLNVVDVRFRSTFAEKYKSHSSWGVELSDPARNISYRIAQQGTLPEIVRWDGKLSDAMRVEPRQRYFYRVLLSIADDVIVTSNWKAFFTRPKSQREGAKVEGSFANLFVEPGLAFGYGSIKTNSYNSSSPLLMGHVNFVFGQNDVGVNFKQTVKELTGYPNGTSDIHYSRFEAGYHYRLLGSRVRAPWSSHSEGDSRLDRKRALPLNLDFGGGFSATTFRSGGNQPIDGELARQTSGLFAEFILEQTLSPFGLREKLTAGYSVFGGKLITLNLDISVTYEGFDYISPGIFMGYSKTSGKPSVDPFDAGNAGNIDISNNVLSAGVVMYCHL